MTNKDTTELTQREMEFGAELIGTVVGHMMGHLNGEPRWRLLEKALIEVTRKYGAMARLPIIIGKYRIYENRTGVWFQKDDGEGMVVSEAVMDAIFREHM